MAELLEIDGLDVRYRVVGGWRALLAPRGSRFVDAVLDASLHVAAGETYGLVGESGSGKTSLARAIIGLVPHQAGSIRFRGSPTGGSDRAMRPLRRDIGMMFQDPVASLSPRLTVGRLLAEPFRIHAIPGRDRAAEARRLIAMVGLDAGFLRMYPHQLSGGQARRVGLARALALDPALVIADEPTAGLDVSVQGEALNLLGALQAEHGMGLLIVTHNLPVIRHISDRLGIMYLGRIVEQGPTRAIFRRPAHPYTAGLIAAVPQPDPDIKRDAPPLEGEIPSLRQRPTGCEFHTRCRFATDMCRSVAPDYRLIAPDRGVRCHFPLG
ncbi:MAG: ABC transporter ATP-binding protein [Alphaproteobacteria bacterium]|nr:ABC transporter ATP-binding protein [Alphaproteobacteria bacterium]